MRAVFASHCLPELSNARISSLEVQVSDTRILDDLHRYSISPLARHTYVDIHIHLSGKSVFAKAICGEGYLPRDSRRGTEIYQGTKVKANVGGRVLAMGGIWCVGLGVGIGTTVGWIFFPPPQ